MAEQSAFTTLKNDNETVSSKQEIFRQLEALGIQKGMVLLVHANLERLGYIVGGAQALIEALMEIVGYDGTLVVPTFTFELLDPACRNTKVAIDCWKDIRSFALPFDKKLTPPDENNTFAMQFLRNEGVMRSYHPVYSFSAWGKYAKIICSRHPLHFGLGKDSPLGRIAEFNGNVLLLGSDYEDCSIFHLARYMNEQTPIRLISAPIINNKKTVWKDMLDVDYQTKNFSAIGEAIEERSLIKTTYIGNVKCKMFSSREAVSLASAYFQIHND